MTVDSDDKDILPPWKETFLARYPRNVKMAATVFFLAIIVLPPAWVHARVHRHANQTTTGTAQEDARFAPYAGTRVDTDVNAQSLNDQDDRTVKLTPAPDPRVSEDTPKGTLPHIGESGAQSWQVYARPFNMADRRPRVAVILTGLGMSRTATDAAISQLPPTVTLAFDAQGPVVGAWIARARQDGHEAILDVPMEPFDYPRSDPGPNALLTSQPNSDNIERFLGALRHASGYVGVTTTSGSRFVTDTEKVAPILQAAHDRGLMVLDARAAPHSVVADVARGYQIPTVAVTQRLDADLAPAAVAVMLENLEKNARLNGRAIGIAAASPAVVAQVQAWAKGLPQRGIALAPVSAMVQ